MPFTPTHVLAVLPFAALKRLPFPFSAMLIGSLIPDLPLFLPLSPGYGTTHSALGLITACLPLGMACFVIFHLAMKRPLLALLPAAIRNRCAFLVTPRPALRPEAVAWALPAVVLGASTHVFWDSFTHEGRWGTRLIPSLNQTVLIVAGDAIPGFKLLQYGSTLIGLPCLALLLFAWLSRQTPEPVVEGSALDGVSKFGAYLALIAVPFSMGISMSLRRGDMTTYGWLGYSIKTLGLVLMISTLVYCLAYHAVEARLLRPR